MRDKLDKLRHVALSISGGRRFYNHRRYPANAPRPHQQLRIKPGDIVDRYWVAQNAGHVIGWWRTGQVFDGDWDRARKPFKKSRKYKACVARFRNGKSWEDSGIIDYMMKRIAKEGSLDQCRTRADVQARYARLDSLWDITQANGALPETPRAAFEGLLVHSGILVHIDRDGKLLFGNHGFHRLAIAKLAGVDEITVTLGVVHPDALRDGGYLGRLAK